MGRGVQWSEAEEVLLCKAHVNVSEDGAVGTDQSANAFWQRIAETFEELVTEAREDFPKRPAAALQTRWSSVIQKDVSLFASVLSSVRCSLCWMTIF